ncbi:hypothetical protein C1637_07945 [Chryseobacterium lactis]|uniref:DUF4329 domain-containing protein n=2 Tax=Chryseobacterium lactis TaxID=1241981 RepID=A0A3G6RFH2_CHRLC|nr:hypothetical protein EG342_11750 [Chryseobacterium lactis]AZB02908.1 hypothetical protein EG341_02610 [Chryseobacterium lactis]PNW13797.1 hypothetical protein C1637_07945 [Chryseobacterium lactis]
MHDEIYASPDLTSNEYTNKSLWKEDEKYIGNVKKVFEKYADKNYFTTNFGTVNWDYALTMGNFDESFLEAPVIKDGKVSFVLVAYREGDRVFFKRKEGRDSNEFFDVLVFKERKQLKGRIVNDRASSKGQLCYTVEVTWTWTNDDGSAGETFSYNKTTCKGSGPYLPCQSVEVNNNCGGATAGGPPGSGSGGSGGYPYTPEFKEFIDNCAKVKTLRNNATFKSNVTNLEGKTGMKGETGYIQRADGSYIYQDTSGQTETSNTLSLPRPDLPENKNIMAYLHTHINDYTYTNADGDEETRTGIKMFSPADVWYLMDMLRNAQEQGRPLSDVYAVMVTSKGNYQIRFIGNQYQIKSFTKQQIEDFTKSYKGLMGEESTDLELSFLNFISETMNVKAVNLYKMDSNGTNYEIKLNDDKKGKITTGCPG